MPDNLQSETLPMADLERNRNRAAIRRAPESAALLAFLVAEIIFFSLSSPYFLTWGNWVNVFTALSITGVLAAGGTMLLIAGQFDLSVGSGVAFVALVLALTIDSLGVLPASVLAMLVGVGIGLINGFLVTRIGVNALITTLGTLAIFRGLTQSIGGGRNIPIANFDWAIWRPFLNIPLSALVFLLVAIMVGIVLKRSVFGRSIYAIGANENAARLVGIRTKGVVFAGFLLSGAFIGLGGLISASQLGSTSGTTGLGLELAVVTAVILGGTSLKGGTGTMLGTVIGLLIVGVLNNGLTLMNVNSSWQQAATGLLLILAVSFDQLRQRLVGRR
ncbi:ABC transporter permease (plasmid) [Sinorhizobium meliloti WSM1022]|jgi:ribose transport system permease protein|uniref:ABC sugar transporter, permease n=6 Tax=Sinorhizobium TaxID=28105 RepID=Q92U86_RHIME|nr:MULTISPECIES: ABC transporter permease [Sinorhizobium]TWB05267.1 monosaccharide ABC transporter membrane protein (CUT2 family) [Ensifer sp. SEMIA 134]TWB41240.1 monosaccharide ABC transporter membrane protein (CUT2 family) [Ensifer sp. SEMIA 135]AGA10484.1 Ribose/xylose/arabinose/galactoside ABC-type transport systems, permease component [Sinorhizobium meliloti GR4]AGG72261.1 ABC sugar transporter,permease [Sinorhizobium meliloti 2011]AIM02896.1 sugar ABC transporter permease [Sinorhizobium